MTRPRGSTIADHGEARFPTAVQFRAVTLARNGRGPRGTKAGDSGSSCRSAQYGHTQPGVPARTSASIPTRPNTRRTTKLRQFPTPRRVGRGGTITILEMRAWRLHELGAPADVLRLEDDVEPPTPGPGQVRLEMATTGLNFFEGLMCRGQYQEKPPLPLTPGAELCGRVVETGEGVDLPLGARMIGMAAWPHGGLAEQALGNARMLFPIPDSMPDEVGAALYMTYGTSHVALHHRGGLQAGETFLVHAGAGGVGSAAIQLGLAAGARVIATAGGPDKVEVCRELGAEVAIDYPADDFVAVVKDATGGRGADVIYDPVGGDVFDRSRTASPRRAACSSSASPAAASPRRPPTTSCSRTSRSSACTSGPTPATTPGCSAAPTTNSWPSTARGRSTRSSTGCCRWRRPCRASPT